MLASMESYLRRGQRQLRRWALVPGVQTGMKLAAFAGCGFFLSAAGLSGAPLPLAAALICAASGWQAAVMALGAALGYRIFWDTAGFPGMIWAAVGLLLALLPQGHMRTRDAPVLLIALSAAAVACTGLGFACFRPEDAVFFRVYLLQVAASAAGVWFFCRLAHCRDPVLEWIAGGIAVFALAGVAPVPYLGFGYIAAGALAVGSAFPGAALAGLGLDLARVTQLPMAAVLCIAYFLRLLPFQERWMRYAAPGAACLTVMVICGSRDFSPLPGMLLGGCLGYVLPPRPEGVRRRGETGIAQVRLELSAGVLSQIQQLLLEAPHIPIDEEALFRKARDRACGACAARGNCADQKRLKPEHLHCPMDFTCRRPGRIREELLRSQEQLRRLKADRLRQQEYRSALVQQYQFLAQYLRDLADRLPQRGERPRICYRLEVSARSRAKERSNGDRCMAFAGTGCRYYVLLCDGMGTGLGAAREGDSMGALLRQMLTAGFPAEHAFRSVNSILLLRGQAGAVTLDLAEVRLDSGQVALYKWGAAPSWVLRKSGAEKIGTATVPPGLSLSDSRETVLRLSLRRGEVLILVSDGAELGDALRRMVLAPEAPPGELAEDLLEMGCGKEEDDATVAVLRLCPRHPSA